MRLLTSQLVLCFVVCILFGCVSETRDVNRQTQSESGGLPPQVLRVPQQMQELSGDLLRYQARNQALPPTLKTLVDDKIMSAESFAELPDYMYEPSSKYTLRDGRVVIVVDSEVRIEGHVWCIVREAAAAPRSMQLNVTPIALSELDYAAKRR